MRNRAEDALPQAHLDGHHAGAACVEHGGPAVEAANRAAVQLFEQVRDIGGNQIDERRRRVQGFGLGERATVVHGLLRERHVALAPGGQRAHVRGDVFRRFLGHHLVDRGAVA